MTPDPEVPRRSVSLEQAGRLLGVSRRTVYHRIADGRLQTIRVGKSQRVLCDSLPEWAQPTEGR